MKFLMLAAALRKDSLNKQLIKLASDYIKTQNHEIDLADFSEFNVPLYDGDVEANAGLPQGAQEFIKRMHAADAVIISSPEYNFSVPGTLKNLVDWVSREPNRPFSKQLLLLMSASPANVGGNRGLWHLRVPLEACGGFVYPEMFSLAIAHNAFKDNGELQDQNLQERLQDNLNTFIKFTHYFAQFKQA